jgi:hypothetical protein
MCAMNVALKTERWKRRLSFFGMALRGNTTGIRFGFGSCIEGVVKVLSWVM